MPSVLDLLAGLESSVTIFSPGRGFLSLADRWWARRADSFLVVFRGGREALVSWLYLSRWNSSWPLDDPLSSSEEPDENGLGDKCVPLAANEGGRVIGLNEVTCSCAGDDRGKLGEGSLNLVCWYETLMAAAFVLLACAILLTIVA
jgi:hypothetical protein